MKEKLKIVEDLERWGRKESRKSNPASIEFEIIEISKKDHGNCEREDMVKFARAYKKSTPSPNVSQTTLFIHKKITINQETSRR